MFKNNNLSYEIYQHLKKSNELNTLRLQSKQIQQSLCRYSLVDNLVYDFPYDYWIVITFGYRPHKDDVEVVLSNAHYRIDRWLLTNLKLRTMTIDQRSKWVCLPEYGNDKHLHYNCFIQLGERPNVTHIGRNGNPSEWLTLKNTFKTTFKAICKMMGWNEHTIQFRLYERRDNKDALRTAMYSTKEMRCSYIDENGIDHFADYIRSWEDWNISPINFKSPKHLKRVPRPTGTLVEFLS